MSAFPPAYDSHPNVGTTLTPYLQLSHRLSLAWLAYPILSIVFIIFRLILSGDSAQNAVDGAKDDLLSACLAAQEAAASTASMPRFMALASNELIVASTNAALSAARQALVLSLTIMEAIINFIIDTYRSTLLCFLELIVRGALSIIISGLKEASDLIQSTASGLRTSIQNDVTSINSAIASIVSKVNDVNPFGDITAPQFDVPDLSSLANLTLPSDLTDALTSLNSSLPSVSQLKSEVDDLVDTPFELVKKEINDTFLSFSFNSSVLPVPERASLSFCDDMDTSTIDDLGNALVKMTRIGIIILAALALLLLAGSCLWEWWQWRTLQKHLQYTREAWATDPAVVHTGPEAQPTVSLSDHNLMMLAASAEHPVLTRMANHVSTFFRLSPSKNINLRWFLHYIFHPPALACFLIGFFGLLSIQIQLLALAPLQAHFQEQAQASAADFSRTISTSMNASMYNQSSLYAAGVNSQLDEIQTTINNGLFGWVNGTTTTLNNTISSFYAEVQTLVNDVFGNTPLAQPAQEFIACFIGSKVDAVENVLTFLNENLQVNVTRVAPDALVLSPDRIDEASQPIARAAVGSGNGPDDGGLVGRLINTYAASLRKERLMFAIFLGLWFLVVLAGFGVIFYHSYGRALLERRKRRKFERSGQRQGVDSVVTPFREWKEKPQAVQLSDAPPQVDLRSFTPIPPEPGLGARLAGAFGKSFDSFFDRDATPSAPPPVESRGPSRLGALSRHLTRTPSDQEKGRVDEAAIQGWWQRLRFSFMNTRGGSRTPDFTSGKRKKPSLTISPELAESVRNSRVLPVIETTSPSEAAPHEHIRESSRWSISPAPAVKPWLRPMITPTQAGPRRKASVPDDVGHSGSLEDMSPIQAPSQPQRMLEVPVALHNTSVSSYQFPAPPPLPPTQAARAFQPPPRRLQNPPGLAPPKRTGPDPFATPFDDDHVPNSPGGRYPVISSRPVQQTRPGQERNPFSDYAPRAF